MNEFEESIKQRLSELKEKQSAIEKEILEMPDDEFEKQLQFIEKNKNMKISEFIEMIKKK